MKRIQGVFLTIVIIFIIMNCIRIKSNFSKEMSSADKNFRKSGWAGHQFGLIEYKNLSLNDWKYETKQIYLRFLDLADKSAGFNNFRDLKYTSEIWLKTYLNNQCDHNKTFHLALFEKEKLLIFIANHALCDGHILYKILTICLNLKTPLKTPQYRRIPIISEISVLRYIFERSIDNIGFNPLPIENTNRRYSLFLPYSNNGRWEVMGTIFHCLYKCLIPKVKSIRIAFTVAWDDEKTNAKNRIGGIIIDIPRKSNPSEYSGLIKKNILKRKKDALISYEIVRNYSVNKLRKKFCHSIDGVCTMLPIDDHVSGFTKWYGGFAGNLKAPFYLNAITYKSKKSPCIGFSIQTCTPYFDEKLLLKKYPDAINYNNYKFPIS